MNEYINNKISVVIPVYNTAQYLETCINSVRKQSYTNIELIVVDDGSDSETKKKLKELSSKIDILIHQENKGQSSARNLGIANTTGEFVLVLDSDDYFVSTFCEKAFKIFKENKQVKIITCQSNLINKDNDVIGSYTPSGGDISKMLLNNTAMGSCMFKKTDWAKVGGYDENMKKGFEDWEFYIRLLSDGGEVIVISEILFNYRIGGVSTTTKANKVKYELLEYIYFKHEEIYKQYFNDFISFLLLRIEKEEQEKNKMYTRLEYRIGYYILKPFRFVKRILNG
ncbi:glycosyltransferase [Polaribacter septentrionalilitoris]|uniref:glycosyltransferase n=1 Tax=Polaribacter septentrionalilitoris TaxID=2494657 RepID=UPI001F34763C|nr:glycosyltransferase [Polaribacter septentrionalilitoris]